MLGAVGNEFGGKVPDSQLLSLSWKDDTTGQKDGALGHGQWLLKWAALLHFSAAAGDKTEL